MLLRRHISQGACLALVFCVLPLAGQQMDNVPWPQWRGPLGTGEGPAAKPPLTWSESDNVKWRVAVAGLGHSTPVITTDRIFLTAAAPVGEALPPRFSGAPGAHDNLPITHRHEFLAICLDRESGRTLWTTKVHEALPHEGAHYTGSLASASPMTDGKYFYAHFGSYGFYCLDLEGRVVWDFQPGKMNTKHGHGEGSSPTMHGNTIVINWDHEGKSFVVALDKSDGRELWRRPRNEVTSWSSPIVMEHGGQQQLIVAGTSRVRGYDLRTGDDIWECGGLSANVVATPVPGDGMVYVGSSYDTRAMMGIRLEGADGDITDTDNVVWSRTHRTPYVPSPVLYAGRLHFLRHYQGILSHVDAKTGREPIPPLRLDGVNYVYASPVAAAGRLFVTAIDGLTVVVSTGEIPRIVARNQLDDEFSASAALAENELYLRGKKYLYCLQDSSDRGNK